MKMTNIEIYVVNMEKYNSNSGEDYGKWFTLPHPLEDIVDELEITGDYAIHDCIAPFPINEATDIDALNEIVELFYAFSFKDYQVEAVNEVFNFMNFTETEQYIDVIHDIYRHEGVRFYHECKSMGDVAMLYYEDSLQRLENESLDLYNAIDFHVLGRELEHQGHFFQ